MLGDWIRAEARRERGPGKPLAYRTLETYLTRIGGAIVEVLGAVDVARWDEQILEDAYLYALDASTKARHKVAAALLSFHHHCAATWDLPQIDLSFLFVELGAGRQQADSSLILPIERSQALASLCRAAWEGGESEFAEVRLARAADWVAYYLAWGGTRLNEALGLQVRDVGIRPNGSLWTVIRSNRLRPLKTPAAVRRPIFAIGPEESSHRQRVTQRVDDARRHAGARRPGSAYLLRLRDCENERLSSSADAVAQLIRQSLAAATGRPSERLHRLRHLAVTQSLMGLVLGSDDRGWIGLNSRASASPLTPRELLAVSVAFGHAHWRTTVQWYLHLPWLLQSRAAQHSREEYFSRRHVAGALGYTCATLDSLLRNRDVDVVSAYFGHFRVGRATPEKGSPPASEAAGARIEWTATRVGQLVGLAAKMKDVEAAMRLVGAPMDQLALVLACAERWEAKLGMRLLPVPQACTPAPRAQPQTACRM